MQRHQQRILALLAKLAGVFLFAWIIATTDLPALGRALHGANLLSLLAAFALFAPIYLLKTLRWHLLLQSAGVRERFRDAFMLYNASLFLGVITPGRVGEAIKIPHLRARGLSLADSIFLTVLDRAFDAFWIALIAVPTILWTWGMPALPWLALGILVPLAVGWVLLRGQPPSPTMLRMLRTTAWSANLLTLANWIVYFWQLAILASGFSISLPLLSFIGIMAVVGVLSLLPIAPAGLGTREAALLFFLLPYGFQESAILAFSLSISGLTLLAVLTGAYAWLRLKKPAMSAAKQREGVDTH